MKIAVIGSGSWGTAISVLIANKGYDTMLWSWKQEETDLLNTNRENIKYLPGIPFPDNITCSHDISLCVKDADLIICAVPSPGIRTTAKKLAPHISDGQIIVNLAKGIENETLLRLSQVIKEEIPQADVAVMSGPSHAEEVAKELPTTNVVAAQSMKTAEFIQDILMTENFRIYTGKDIIGVELGGALKNIIALCAGICDGLGFGDNTKAALMTRGIAEIARLGVAMGADRETFLGLSGVGDLIVTCTSMHSRNRRCGILLGKGLNSADAIKEIGMVVEGINASGAAYELSKKYDIYMPITKAAYEILFENKSPLEVTKRLMTGDKKSE